MIHLAKAEPWKAVAKAFGKKLVDKLWVQCNKWLKKFVIMCKEAKETGWQRAEQEWG